MSVGECDSTAEKREKLREWGARRLLKSNFDCTRPVGRTARRLVRKRGGILPGERALGEGGRSGMSAGERGSVSAAKKREKLRERGARRVLKLNLVAGPRGRGGVADLNRQPPQPRFNAGRGVGSGRGRGWTRAGVDARSHSAKRVLSIVSIVLIASTASSVSRVSMLSMGSMPSIIDGRKARAAAEAAVGASVAESASNRIGIENRIEN